MQDSFFTIVWVWITMAVITGAILLLSKIRAPYGRHTRTGWGKMIDNHWGWFWMELPALIVMPALSLLGPAPKYPLLLLLTGMWLLHYGYRVLIFPFQLRTRNKKIPLSIIFSAFFFNLVNGSINGYFLGFMADPVPIDWSRAGWWWGMILFFGGMYINRTADRRLIALRRSASGYFIPQGWWFRYISCPNHFGEIVEWLGFALVAWNLPAASFAIWTLCNLAPRAQNHHDWYRECFPDYPQERKALIPFVW